MRVEYGQFEWDFEKEQKNIIKHNIDFIFSTKAFLDPNRVILLDLKNSKMEDRFYCLGKIENEIITVRFTMRGNLIRIIGAGYWRKGKKIYEKERSIY